MCHSQKMTAKTDHSRTVQECANIYGVNFWGKPYFSINKKGHVQIHPKGIKQPSLDLFEITGELRQSSSMRLPLLLRFPDIIESQINNLCGCFARAISEMSYQGRYYGVFPIKVNQQSHIIEDIVRAGGTHNFGLEAGSKPELLIALSLMENPERLIICNGFKDRDYLEMALLAQKAGKNIIIVAERERELDAIIELSQTLNSQPRIGFRLKLSARSGGLWAESSGNLSKFGFTAERLLSAFEKLKDKQLLNCVELAHFHIGSQAPSIQPIKSAVRETARIVGELRLMGCAIKYVDVGGGLGVDYDGSGATRSSTNYDAQEYANDIVHGIQSVCDEMKIPHPHIISESGRFIVAQSSLLVFDVLDSSSLDSSSGEKEREETAIPADAPAFVRDLWDIYKNLRSVSFNESFNDLVEKKRDMRQLFVYNVLSLREMALSERIYRKAAGLLKQLVEGQPDYDDIFNALDRELSAAYFCNFSIFQSLPDSWALSYIFPVMPIHRLNEPPDKNARLMDLTCDSDGKIAKFIDYKTWNIKPHLPVHSIKPGEPYLMAVFLTGAYQEILGDLHNLFGDTDAVHISAKKNGGYVVEHQVEGDSISEVLEYVEFYRKNLINNMRAITEKNIQKGDISRKEAGDLLKKFEASLSQYTYLNNDLPGN